MKKYAVVFIALMLILASAIPAMASRPADIETRYEEGVVFIPLREAAYVNGITVDWNEEHSSVMLTWPNGGIATLQPLHPSVGGFIEHGTSWIPAVFFDQLMLVFADHEIAGLSRTEGIWVFENFEQRYAAFSTGLAPGEISIGYIRFMNDNLYSRSPFSYREKEAAKWLVEELLAMGHGWEYIYVQEFTFGEVGRGSWSSVIMPNMLGDGIIRQEQLSQNVILTVPGQSDSKIIVGAHYDTLRWPGASDNASGVALLLESAMRIQEQDNYHTIVYVFFGAEEVGLLGAWFYLESLSDEQRDNIVKMINADVLFEGPYFVYGAGTGAMPDEEELMKLLVAILEIQGIEFEIPEGAAVEDLVDPMLLLTQAVLMGLAEIGATDVTAQVSEIAQELRYLYDINLITHPLSIFGSSDNLVFVMSGHNVVNLVGFQRLENVDDPYAWVIFEEFTMQFLHSDRDNFDYIEAHSPGMMAEAMRTFSILLEGLLLAEFE